MRVAGDEDRYVSFGDMDIDIDIEDQYTLLTLLAGGPHRHKTPSYQYDTISTQKAEHIGFTYIEHSALMNKIEDRTRK
jgi:hypothetical protein